MNERRGLASSQRTNGNVSFPDCFFPFIPKEVGHSEMNLPLLQVRTSFMLPSQPRLS